jgi:hypothetical protein
VGASGWEYVVPYQSDMTEALASLRRRVFAEGSYLSPSELGLRAPRTTLRSDHLPRVNTVSYSAIHGRLATISAV